MVAHRNVLFSLGLNSNIPIGSASLVSLPLSVFVSYCLCVYSIGYMVLNWLLHMKHYMCCKVLDLILTYSICGCGREGNCSTGTFINGDSSSGSPQR